MKPNNKIMNLQTNLKLIMDQKNLSTTQLSKISKIRKQRISDWLCGVKPKDIDQVKTLANALNVTLDSLLFGHAADEIDNTVEGFADSEVVFKVTVKRVREK